jgi:hypothetical protein
VDGCQGYLVRTVACHLFILRHVAHSEGNSMEPPPARNASIITMADSPHADEGILVPDTFFLPDQRYYPMVIAGVLVSA